MEAPQIIMSAVSTPPACCSTAPIFSKASCCFWRMSFFNRASVVRSDLERNIADTEARLKNDIRQKQQEAFEKIGAVEQQAELRSAEASRRLGALDLRMSGVQGGLGEHKRDILKLRKEVNGLTVKNASHEA